MIDAMLPMLLKSIGLTPEKLQSLIAEFREKTDKYVAAQQQMNERLGHIEAAIMRLEQRENHDGRNQSVGELDFPLFGEYRNGGTGV